MADDALAVVQKKLDYRFKDPRLLALALTHASSADLRTQSNERLEFLGDSVLGLIVCEELYRAFPTLLEGDLTKIKSTVVSRKTCADVIEQMGLADFLVLGKGMMNHDTLPGSVAAALLEALVGAIYLDAGDRDEGLTAARTFLLKWFEPIIQNAAESGHQQNFKSVLQQHAQERLDAAPTYVLLDEQGPDHAKCFEVCVQLGAERFESSWGQSKKDAEQQAALRALIALGLLNENECGQVRTVGGDSNGDDDEEPRFE